MRRSAILATLSATVLVGCNVAATSSIPNPQSASAGFSRRQSASDGREYLFVADQDIYQSRERQLIQRFALHGGIPQKSPGFTIYPTVGFNPGDLIAVDGAGNLYSTLSGDDGPVYVFAPDKKVPTYTLDLPNPAACDADPSSVIQVSAMTVDSRGYVFVNFATWADGVRTKRPAPAIAPDGTICSGIWVFAPGARGKKAPIATIRLERIRAAYEMSVDGSDNLYAAINDTHVAEYANATTNPVRTRVFYRRGRSIGSVATDEKGNVFIGTSVGGPGNPRIDRFSATGDPHDRPINSIEPPNLGFLAASARHVFVSDGQSLNVYHAFERGAQQPLYSFSSHEVYTIAVGP